MKKQAPGEEKFTKQMRRLAANLRRFRDARGLSQDDVIYLADVDRRGYQRLKNGRVKKNPK